MTTNSRQRFTQLTLKFCIVGFFIPGFTAILIMLLQQGIQFLGIGCSTSWVILWTVAAIGMVLAPFIFVRLMSRTLTEGFDIRPGTLIVFNIVEYTCAQAALASLFTHAHTLCYVADGQNGIEFVFTGWLALPFLVALSWLFDMLLAKKLNMLQGEKSAYEP